MIDRNLAEREIDLAENSYSTAAPFETTAYYIGFPQSVSGLKILDIGSGASTTVLELRKRGAKAFGMDVRYRDFAELSDSVDGYIDNPNHISRQARDMSRKRFLAGLQKAPSADTDKQLLQIANQIIINLHDDKNLDPYFINQREQLELFLSPQSERPYVAGSAAFLPFRDRSFDLVYSLQAISQFLISDKDVFMQSVSEALRVLKVHGQVRLHPWTPEPKNIMDPRVRKSMMGLIQYLDQRRITHKTEQISPFNQPRLIIYKHK